MNIDSAIVRDFVAHGKCESCPVINTHAHFGPYKGIYFPRHAPEKVIATLDRCGARYLVAAAHGALGDTQRGNREYEKIMAQYPDRFKGYWAINPNYPQRVRDEVAAFTRDSGFVGFKFLSDYYAYPLNGEAYAPALEYADAHHLPILLHTWGGSVYDGPKLVDAIAEKYPQAILLMGHAGFGDWHGAAQVAARHPHVYLELTAAYAVRGAVELLVQKAGSEKIVFGDDHPWFSPYYGIGCVLFADITDTDRENILFRNAERIFGL